MIGLGNKNQSKDGGSVNLIGNGTQIVGDINSNGDLRIDGLLTGNISISGKFVLGSNGIVKGNITSETADIEGEINGDISITETLSLKKTAKINGNILTGKLSIESGAVFTGSCNMGAKVKNIVQPSDQLHVKSKSA